MFKHLRLDQIKNRMNKLRKTKNNKIPIIVSRIIDNQKKKKFQAIRRYNLDYQDIHKGSTIKEYQIKIKVSIDVQIHLPLLFINKEILNRINLWIIQNQLQIPLLKRYSKRG